MESATPKVVCLDYSDSAKEVLPVYNLLADYVILVLKSRSCHIPKGSNLVGSGLKLLCCMLYVFCSLTCVHPSGYFSCGVHELVVLSVLLS